MIPDEGRADFYGTLETLIASGFTLDEKMGRGYWADSLNRLETLYTYAAIAVVDLGLSLTSAGPLMAEAALAGISSLAEETELLPLYQLRPLFELSVIGDDAAAKAFAKDMVGRSKKKSKDPHTHGLLIAACGSWLGDPALVKRGLDEAKAGLAKKKGSALAWATAMSDLARESLTGDGTGLSEALALAGSQTRARFAGTEQTETLNYESYLARMVLLFASRARARGLKLPKSDPDPAVPLVFLDLEPQKLPDHPWHAWPKLPTPLLKKIAKARAG